MKRVDLLLHVGAGTFKPVETEDPANHVMHEEWYRIGDVAAATLNATRKSGAGSGPVGTTSVRTLETAVRPDGSFAPQSGETRIFIRSPYEFRAVDKLITNFHLRALDVDHARRRIRRVRPHNARVSDGARGRLPVLLYGDAMAIL